MVFLSTPSARRATWVLMNKTTGHYISIHALREEGDLVWCLSSISSSLFLSTPSARRATTVPAGRCRTEAISIHALREEGDTLRLAGSPVYSDFYPRPPRGGRHCSVCKARAYCWISIHALREEGDACGAGATLLAFLFLSTPSARRATVSRYMDGRSLSYFYPRPPRGGRPLP